MCAGYNSFFIERLGKICHRPHFHLLILVLFITIQLNSQADLSKITHDSLITAIEIPETTLKDNVILHSGYSLIYDEQHEQAAWVAYTLTAGETIKHSERTNDFRPDPTVTSGTATDEDYASSGYDRGHLAPAGDMSWSSTAMKESFYYSNISPQEPAFNRGIWKKLEELCRDWATENDSVCIVTGPVLTKSLKTIGTNKVSVPTYYYKVILDCSPPSLKGIAFLIPNCGSPSPVKKYVVSIDSVEMITGINFFPLLPDIEENKIEKTRCTSCWTWKKSKPPTKPGSRVPSHVSSQCKGETASGSRCKKMTKSSTGKCNLHQ